jgi:hypothetical protein
MLVVLLLCTSLAYASSVPIEDDPDTAFNEADTPVSLAPPAPVSFSFKLAPPVVDPIHVPHHTPQSDWKVGSTLHRLAPVTKQLRSFSVPIHLCTLLI